jgi:hypothetical protein
MMRLSWRTLRTKWHRQSIALALLPRDFGSTDDFAPATQRDYPRPSRLALPATGAARQESASRYSRRRDARHRMYRSAHRDRRAAFRQSDRAHIEPQARDGELYIFKIVKQH